MPLPSSIRDIRITDTDRGGVKGQEIWMRDNNFRLHIFTGDDARNLAAELVAAADELDGGTPNVPALVGDKTPAKAGTTKPTKRGTRLSEGWLPTAEDIEILIAEFPFVTKSEWSNQHRIFIDYWTALPGTVRATKLDWSKTWRNWMRKEFSGAQYRRRAMANSQYDNPGPSKVDAKAASYLED